jgi:hypothetical protein
MVADDNKRGALPTLEFSKSCSLLWRRFGLLHWNWCIVTGVQWDRQNGKLRVYLDARGESNLQHPLGSTLTVRGDNGMQKYRAESGNEQVGIRGHYKGCLILDESIFSREESNFHFCCANLTLFASSCRPIDLLPGNLGSFSFDRYTLNDSLYEDDTPEVELTRWEDVNNRSWEEWILERKQVTVHHRRRDKHMRIVSVINILKLVFRI